MDDVRNHDVSLAIEHLGFMALGVFTTCCFTRNFAALDLMRAPLTVKGRTSGGIATFELPDWLPHEQAIFSVGGGKLFSKLRELPLARKVTVGDGKVKQLAVELPEAISANEIIELTYSPWFRFAHVGKIFSINGSISEFVCRTVEYAARRVGYQCSDLVGSQDINSVVIRNDVGSFKFSAIGYQVLNEVKLEKNTANISVNFEDRTLNLSREITPQLFNAINKLNNSQGILENCRITVVLPDEINLRYEA